MTERKPQRSPRPAEWQNRATEIGPQKAGHELSLTRLCDATGLKPSAVMSYVNRTGQAVRGAMAPLMRPAYRIGATPYWSQEQVDAYFQAKAERTSARAAMVRGLPEVSQEEADERGLCSLRKLSAWSGFALVTLHRMANSRGFPEPVAVVPSNGPNPLLMRDRAAVEEWLRANRAGWKPVAER